MKHIWSRQHQIELWLRVELAVCRAWERDETIPVQTIHELEKVEITPYFIRDMESFEEKNHHEVVAFINAIAVRMPTASRYVHFGLTSSDVVDTALAIQIIESLQSLTDLSPPLWVESTLWDLRKEIGVGKLSGPVGNHSSFPPALEEIALRSLNLRYEPISTQIVQRDRHAYLVQILCWVGCILARDLGRVRALEFLITANSCVVPALENVALWHERDISHSSVERINFPQLFINLYNLMKEWKDATISAKIGSGGVAPIVR